MSFSYWQSALEPRLARIREADLPNTSESAPLMRMMLETEERAIRSNLSRVRIEINKLNSVSKLTPTLLQCIFSHLAIEEPVPNASWPTRDRERKHWTKVTYVCGKWRSAALTHPSLWASPPLNLGSDRFHAFIGRSVDEPLCLRLDEESEISSSLLLTALQEHSDRIRELDSSVVVSSDVLQALAQSMPLLERFHIFPPRPTALDEEPRVELPLAKLPGQLFARQAPQLRALTLRGFSSFPLQPAILENLTSLHFTHDIPNPPKQTDKKKQKKGPLITRLLEAVGGADADVAKPQTSWRAPDPEFFISALKSIHRLEALTLHGCLPDKKCDVETLVELRHLQHLSVSGSFDACVWFFENMRLLPACRVRILAEAPPKDWEADLPRMVGALTRSGYLGEDNGDTSDPRDATDDSSETVEGDDENESTPETETETDIDIDTTDLDTDDASSIAPSTSAEFDTTLAGFFRTLRLLVWSPTSRGRHCFQISTWSSSPDSFSSPAHFSLELAYTPLGGHTQVSNLFRFLRLPLHRVRTLYVDGALFGSGDPLCWPATFGTCPSIEEIHTSGVAGKNIVSALAPLKLPEDPAPGTVALRTQGKLEQRAIPEPSLFARVPGFMPLPLIDTLRKYWPTVAEGAILFPRLRALTLAGVELDDDYGYGQLDVGWKVLRRTLLARQERGCGALKVIRINGEPNAGGTAAGADVRASSSGTSTLPYWCVNVSQETGVAFEHAPVEDAETAERWAEVRREMALPRETQKA